MSRIEEKFGWNLNCTARTDSALSVTNHQPPHRTQQFRPTMNDNFSISEKPKYVMQAIMTFVEKEAHCIL